MGTTLGGIGLVLLSGVAFAQDDVDAELEALEQEEAQTAEPAPSTQAAEPEAGATPPPVAPPADVPPPAAQQAQTAAEEESDELDVVQVTVDRRAKNRQDYAGVAAAFSENKLSSVGITNARDLASMVPGLQVGVQEGNTEMYIRGVGSDNNTELGDPSVALHIDGVYIPRPRGVGSMFFDIERVEVQSGPQGTLRGRNAMGGTVNIVSKKPQLGEFGADAEATFGTFNQRRYQGMVNIPLGDLVAVRAAGFSEVRDSYYENAGPIEHLTPAENADAFAYRVQLKYQPTSKFYALLGYDLTSERGTGYLGANMQGPLTAFDDEDPMNPVPIPFEPNDLDNPRRVYYRGAHPSVDMTHQGFRGLVSYDAGPAIIDVSASYRDLKYEQTTGGNAGVVYPGYDFSAVNAAVGGGGYWDSRSQSLIGEVRIYAPDDARLRWTVGGFFFDESQQVFLGQVSDPANFFGGGEFNMPDVVGRSFAGYADTEFDLTDDLTLFAGLRYTSEHKERTGGLWSLLSGFPGNAGRYGTDGFQFEGLDREAYTFADVAGDDEPGEALDSINNRVQLYLAGIRSFGAEDQVPVALCNDPPEGESRLEPNIAGSGFQCAYGARDEMGELNSQILNAVPQNFEVDNSFLDYRVGAKYDLNKDSNVYFTVTTGHKASGFNDTVPGATEEFFNSEYGSESVTAFALGSNNMLFERKLRLNAEAFLMRYDDLVFQVITPVEEDPDPTDDQTPPTSAVRQNAENTTNIMGIDVDLNYRLPLGLEAELHVLAMDARFPDGTYVNDSRISFNPAENYEVDIGGNWLPRVSPVTVNFALSQLIFSNIGSFNWVVQGQTRTQHYMTVFNGEGDGELLPPAPGETVPDNDPQVAGGLIETGTPGAFQRLTDIVPTYTRFDIGAGWKHPDGRISINGFVNNVFNIAYATSIISTPGLNLRFFNPPRTAGLRFRVDW